MERAIRIKDYVPIGGRSLAHTEHRLYSTLAPDIREMGAMKHLRALAIRFPRMLGFFLVSRLPLTQQYRTKAFILRCLCGLEIAPTARIVSSARFLLKNVTIGDHSFVGHEFRAYGGSASHLTIGSNVDIGPNVVILTGTHDLGDPARRAGVGRSTTVQIEDGVWVCGRVTIIGPATIGTGCVLAAGAIVSGNIPSNSLVKNYNECRLLAGA